MPLLSHAVLDISAIATCQTMLTEKIEVVQLDMGLIRQDTNKLRSQVSKTEQRVGPRRLT